MPYFIPQYKLSLVRENNSLSTQYRTLSTSREVYETMKPYMEALDREHFSVIYLDAQHRPIALHNVAVGSLSLAIVHPREVFKGAIIANAMAIIALHNHPSGDCTPSMEDRHLTHRLYQVGELVGIPLLDHVVIGEDRYFSFADQGMLKP